MTLAKAFAPSQTLPVKAAMILGGSALIALAAQVSVPMWPVPMTLQTLAILTIGFAFGARMGAATVVAYLVEGAIGLPVFAQPASPASLVGPTAGFLYGFVGMAFLAGLAADRGLRGFVPMALAGIAISALLYIPGLLWPAIALGTSAADLWAGWMSPFLVGDGVKAVLAALVVTGGWAALSRRA
jgi:biotin transport system substrate-specific component